MKEILERYGFAYKGKCSICGGNADLYQNGKYKVKVMPARMKFILEFNGKRIAGRSGILEDTLQKNIT